jgi:aryl-alcohol dehydrogenase-like predicted oxidoreductase
MRSVTLPDGRRTSALGFGCAALVGGRTRKQALRLLASAYAAGIRHFDVARVYGTGDAEEILGAFARSRLDEVTIATKFGIDPLPPTRSVDVAKRVVRGVARRWPGLLDLMRRQTGRVVTRGSFSPEKARSSLEVSLARLGVPRVDLYLLHDCTREDWAQAALRDELAAMSSEGVIGAYGPATGRQAATAILELPAPSPAVIQSEASILEPPLRAPEVPLRVTFGSVRGALAAIAEKLARDGTVAARWRAELEIDVGSPAELAPLLIAEALDANAGGIVLVSAGSEHHIERCASAAEHALDAEQLGALRRLAADLR